jgi:hypothetical protein
MIDKPRGLEHLVVFLQYTTWSAILPESLGAPWETIDTPTYIGDLRLQRDESGRN